LAGGMTLLRESTYEKYGDSICEDDKMELALEILENEKGVQIHIPVGCSCCFL
jgi:phosphoglycerate kinase